MGPAFPPEAGRRDARRGLMGTDSPVPGERATRAVNGHPRNVGQEHRLINRPRALISLRDARLDGLIASAPENVTYLTGLLVPSPYLRREVQVFAVLTPDPEADPILVMPASFLAFLVDEPIGTGTVRVYGDPHTVLPGSDAILEEREARLLALVRSTPRFASAQAALLSACADAGLERGRLALDETGLSPQAWGAIHKRLSDAQIVEGAALLRRIRAVKTPAEVARLRRSAEIIEAAQDAMFCSVKEGVTERILAEIIERRVWNEGAHPAFSYLGLGVRGGALRPACDSPARGGDLVRTEMGCTHLQYWSDTGRTAVIGAPSDRQRRCFDALAAGHRAALDALRSGTPVGDVFGAAVRAVRRSGIPEYRRTHCGHGIGLQLYDAPLVAPSDETILEPGMVVNVEVPYYELGFGGMQIEDTGVVTDGAPFLLTRAARELRVLS